MEPWLRLPVSIILLSAALWLIGVGLYSLLRPRQALKGLSKFSSTALINYTELIIRLCVGLAFIARAPLSDSPQIFKILGVFLALSAVIIMLIPRTWHAKYSVYWSKTIPPWAVRLLAPISIIMGVLVMRFM